MTREQMISQLEALYGPLANAVDDLFISVVEDIGYEALSDRGLELLADRANSRLMTAADRSCHSDPFGN